MPYARRSTSSRRVSSSRRISRPVSRIRAYRPRPTLIHRRTFGRRSTAIRRRRIRR